MSVRGASVLGADECPYTVITTPQMLMLKHHSYLEAASDASHTSCGVARHMCVDYQNIIPHSAAIPRRTDSAPTVGESPATFYAVISKPTVTAELNW